MQVADELIRDIVSGSQIPSEKKRQAILRELRSHLEDSIFAARAAGRSDDEIRRLVLASFGDPGKVAQGFAWVYRHDRTMLRIATFLLATVTAASVLSAAIFAMQAGIAIGFGAPIVNVIASRHTVTEALDILSTATAYVGFISIEKLVDGRCFLKALAVLTLTFVIAITASTAASVHAPFLVFGFVSGVFLRTIQVLMKSSLARTGVTIACFVAVGLLFQPHATAIQYAVARSCASWLVMGAGYHLRARLAPRVDEALWKGLQRF